MFCFISLKIKNEWLRGVLVFGIGGIGVLLGTYHLFLPCYIDSAMSALPFFYCGYLLKKTPLLYPNIYDKYNALWIVLFYGVALCIARWFDDPYIHFSTNSIIGNWILGIILSLSDVMAVLFLCKTIKHIPFVSYFGRYSIIPLCTHHLVYLPLKYILIRFNISGGGDFTYIHNINLLGLYPSVSETYSLVYCQKDLLPNPMPIRTK